MDFFIDFYKGILDNVRCFFVVFDHGIDQFVQGDFVVFVKEPEGFFIAFFQLLKKKIGAEFNFFFH